MLRTPRTPTHPRSPGPQPNQHMLTNYKTYQLLFVTTLCVALLAQTFQGDGEPLVASLALTGIAYAATYALIVWLGPTFISAGFAGRDMAKKGRPELPEAMGAVAAVVYLFVVIIFIPFPFYKDIVAATSGGGNRDVVVEGLGDVSRDGRILHRFPHSKLASYLSAILSLQSVVILGLADDLFDIRWRHKFGIPAVAAIPVLIVYFVDFGVTSVVVPLPLRAYLGELVNLGVLYYAYMAAVAIFCPNSINILAGINGLEVAQSICIASLLLLNDILYLNPFSSHAAPSTDPHRFSVYLLLPFIGVSLALLQHNWFPARVFVGDTYCYFAGMVFAIDGILGHFSKTLLLLFIPQVINFIYSAPQLFHLVPCPRHRLPRFDSRTGLLEPSRADIDKPLHPVIETALRWLHWLRLVDLSYDWAGRLKDCTNLTILNLLLVWFGPMTEARLAWFLVLFQMATGLAGLAIRHRLARLIFDFDN